MLGHASAAMTLDVYAGLFNDDLDAVAGRLYPAAALARADYLRTEAVSDSVPPNDFGGMSAPVRRAVAVGPGPSRSTSVA